ncbi:endoribonuclease MazF [Thermus tengchongensis]|uniref:endoribonuclease MazF n=1 Tax=Thermus tengchongensis TaxID=1214928 RepID=UPI001F1B7922|nr:endoribonuclease MazF [Thermus tengchongensis]
MSFVPDRGDLVWLDFDPQAGHEQSRRRPALTLSPKAYNARAGLALFCPVPSRVKGYPFEVPLTPGLPVAGVALADQVRSLDHRARQAEPIARAPEEVIRAVLARVKLLLD